MLPSHLKSVARLTVIYSFMIAIGYTPSDDPVKGYLKHDDKGWQTLFQFCFVFFSYKSEIDRWVEIFNVVWFSAKTSQGALYFVASSCHWLLWNVWQSSVAPWTVHGFATSGPLCSFRITLFSLIIESLTYWVYAHVLLSYSSVHLKHNRKKNIFKDFVPT